MFAIKKFLLLIVCLAILFLIAGTSIAGGLSFITFDIFRTIFFASALIILIVVAVNSRRARASDPGPDADTTEAIAIVERLMEKHGFTQEEALDMVRFYAETEFQSRKTKHGLFGHR